MAADSDQDPEQTSSDAKRPSEVLFFEFGDDGVFPNNPKLPVILYRGAFSGTNEARNNELSVAANIEATFQKNGWTNSWRDTIYDYHHYHSTAHEVLGCCAGHARVQLGGPSGPKLEFATGDVLAIPAGVVHKRVASSSDFEVVGAYANGEDYDMNSGSSNERPAVEERIARVALPELDPVTGRTGPVTERWLSG